MESKKRRSSGEICMVDNAIQPLERPNANGGRHTDLRSGKIGTQLLSIALLLLMAALFVGPLWKRSRIETGGVAEVPGDALERHPIPILNNPEDNESWYLLNQHGRITSITLQGKTVNAGMTLEQLTDLLGKPSRFAVGDQ